ncbi:MAG: GNAT family N-acetyltransferase [Puniceicoccales bacterium]|nr:GNAT family N-acetyltransferase [Puniceicoccales bacterium]
MSRHRELKSHRLRLRPLEITDGERITEFMGERAVTKFLLYFTYPINPEQVRAWLQSVLSLQPEQCAYWAIVDQKEDLLIGIASLTLDGPNQKGEIGYWMDKAYWGKGLMTEAIWRVIHYSFDELKLHRLDLTHMVENIASQRVAEKLGFQLEGCWREGHYKDGTFRDVKIYGMLAVDYLRMKKRFGEMA